MVRVVVLDNDQTLLGLMDEVLRMQGWECLALPGDTCVAVDPTTMQARLERAGFVQIEVELDKADPAQARRFRFSARVAES